MATEGLKNYLRHKEEENTEGKAFNPSGLVATSPIFCHGKTQRRRKRPASGALRCLIILFFVQKYVVISLVYPILSTNFASTYRVLVTLVVAIMRIA